jgi:exopolyphosphatase/guanosine-5'-triphosphate,3'-diphosphate pyrophosphatase
MRSSRGALREGVIYDLVGRLEHEDVRERSIRALIQRYHADEATAELVARRARLLFEAVCDAWKLDTRDGELVAYAALAHEIGKAISHKHFHRHGAYLLRNSDLPGFSQQDQEDMALLVAGQQGKLRPELFPEGGDEAALRRLQRLVALLRLAVTFKYVEELEHLPELAITAKDRRIQVTLPRAFLQRHPLTQFELKQQRDALRRLDLRLEVRQETASSVTG